MSIFSHIKTASLPRNGFDLSYNSKMTAEMGKLYPILVQDVLPGDVFKVNTSIFIRLSPLIAPMMSQVDVYVHYFYVPKRLLWTHFTEFITGQPQDESRINRVQSQIDDEYVAPEYPYLDFPLSDFYNRQEAKWFTTGSLADYLGFPVFDRKNQDGRYVSGTTGTFKLDILPFRAYHLICNEFYRDQNLSNPLYLGLDVDGDIETNSDSTTYIQQLLDFRNRCWKKDYFTSALPFAQAGPDVELPLSGNATVNLLNNDGTLGDVQAKAISLLDFKVPYGVTQRVHSNSGSIAEYTSGDSTLGGSVVHQGIKSSRLSADISNPLDNTFESTSPVYLDPPRDNKGHSAWRVDVERLANRMRVDLSSVSSATINELRRAIAAQAFLEAEARGGSRYIEELYNIFGVKSSDARLQRPEYLGGGKQPIVVSDVLQTSQTTQGEEGSPQGNQSGVGASIGNGHGFRRRFEEHGYIMGFLSIIPKSSYQQGLPRMYQKFDRLDHYIPQFAHLGEQEIKNSEVYFNGKTDTASNDDSVFGYTPRYAEYKFNNDQIHGDFRDELSFWHLGRIFDQRPYLNQDFVESDPSTRVFAVETRPDGSSVDHFWLNINHQIKAIRSMPRFGTPHF